MSKKVQRTATQYAIFEGQFFIYSGFFKDSISTFRIKNAGSNFVNILFEKLFENYKINRYIFLNKNIENKLKKNLRTF